MLILKFCPNVRDERQRYQQSDMEQIWYSGCSQLSMNMKNENVRRAMLFDYGFKISIPYGGHTAPNNTAPGIKALKPLHHDKVVVPGQEYFYHFVETKLQIHALLYSIFD